MLQSNMFGFNTAVSEALLLHNCTDSSSMQSDGPGGTCSIVSCCVKPGMPAPCTHTTAFRVCYSKYLQSYPELHILV